MLVRLEFLERLDCGINGARHSALFRFKPQFNMQTFIQLWSAYAICYAIGYMLWVRPNAMQVNKKAYDVLFYLSLLVFSSLKFVFRNQ